MMPREIRREGMREALKIIAKAIRQEAPRSGRKSDKALYRRIRYQVRKQGLEGIVGAKAPHAHLVEKGTRAHYIPAKQGRFLVFSSGGKLILRKGVWHPGAKANPFMKRALDESKEAALKALREAGEKGRDAIT